jgi:pimeloyl-ACP methyl ester carboxylesterase
VLEALAATGRRVLAYDQRGQFESAGPDDHAAYTIPALARDLIEVLESVGPPVHVVAHSFGGLVAREAMIRRPDLARSLTMLDSGPAALGGGRRDHLEFMGPMLAEGGLTAVYAALTALQAADPAIQALPRETHEFLERRFLSQSAAAVLVTGQALMDEPDRVEELRAAYTGPLLVACGEGDDAWTPDVQKEMAARLGAPFEVIPDAIHSPAAENPAGTAAVLVPFWDDAEAGGTG